MARPWAVIATLLSLSPSEAASDDALAFRIAQLNKTAVYLIEEKQFDSARKRLLEAEQLAKEGGDVGDALLPRTHVNLGALEILEGKRSGATRYFSRALCRQPGIRPDGYVVARPVVVKVFDAVRAAFRPPPGCRAVRNRPHNEPDLPVKIAALDCPNPDEAFLGTAFIVRCAAAPRLAIARVMLTYRKNVSDEFVTVEMRRTARGWWTGAVPEKDVNQKSIQYYFEGLNSAGHAVVANGSRDSPNIALVMESEFCGCDAF